MWAWFVVLLVVVGAAPLVPDQEIPQLKQGTIEKFMMPTWSVSVSYANTTYGSDVRCFPSPISTTACVPYALFMPPLGLPSHLWVYFHPNAEDIGSSHPTSLFQTLQLATKQFNAALVAIEYPGYGQADGEAIQSHIDPAMLSSLDHIITKWGVPSEQIVLVGYSIGTGISAQLAVSLQQQGHNIAGLALIAPYASVMSLGREKVAEALPVFSPLADFIPDTFWNTGDNLRKLTCPIWVSYAKGDQVIAQSEPLSLLDIIHSRPNVASRSWEDTELIKEGLADGKVLGVLLHQLVLPPSLASPEFRTWFTSNIAPHIPTFPLLASTLAQSSRDRLLGQPIRQVLSPTPSLGVDISSMTGIVESLYYDRLFAEQSDTDWRSMVADFAWEETLGRLVSKSK